MLLLLVLSAFSFKWPTYLELVWDMLYPLRIIPRTEQPKIA